MYHRSGMTTDPTPTEAEPCDCWEILPQDVPGLRRQFEDMLLLDCRTEAEYRVDHLHGAVLLPVQELSLRESELEPWKHRVVAVYCRSGRRSHIVARYLAERGFECVRSVAGGLEAWRADDVEDAPC